ANRVRLRMSTAAVRVATSGRRKRSYSASRRSAPRSRPSRRAVTASSPIVAASRRPRVSPWAPIGGATGAAPPARAPRDEGDARGGEPFGALHSEREYGAPRLDRHLAEDRVGAAFDCFRQNVGRERGEAFRLVRLDHADEARTIARQRHDRERTSLGVEL